MRKIYRKVVLMLLLNALAFGSTLCAQEQAIERQEPQTQIEKAMKELKNENARVRESAAWALSGLADRLEGREAKNTAEILIKKLEDEDYAVRRNVVYALTGLGPRLEGETAKRMAYGLLTKLEDESWDVRQVVPAALESVALRLEETTLDTCLEALLNKFMTIDDEYDQARYAAANAYGSILAHLKHEKIDPLAQSLLTKLEDKEIKVRQACLMALTPIIVRLEGKKAGTVATALLERLKDPELEEYVTDQYVIQPLGELSTRVSDSQSTFILDVLFGRLVDGRESDRIRRSAGNALRPGVPRMTHEQRERLIQLIITDPNGASTPAPIGQLLELVVLYLDGQRAREVAATLLAQFGDLNRDARYSTIISLATMAEHLGLEQLEKAITNGEKVIEEERFHSYSMSDVEQAVDLLKERKQVYKSIARDFPPDE